jgi:uncharacterized membrane protein YqjE
LLESSRDPGNPSPPEAVRAAAGSSPGSILTALTRDLVSLFAGKLRLAELELSRDLSGLGTTAILAFSLVLLLVLFLAFAGAGAALLLGQAIGSTALGLLVVAGIYLLAGLVVILAGWRRLRRLRRFLGETRADLKRDMEWLRSLQ